MSRSITPSPIVRFFFGRIFPIPFIIAGAVVMTFGVRDVLRAKASVGWPVDEGGVIRSSVVESRRGNKGGTTYTAKVTYDYHTPVGVLTGNQIAFGGYGSGDSSRAETLVRHYPPGSDVKVSYSPEDPSLSVLNPGLNGMIWFMPGIGAVFLTVGCTMAVFLPRAMRKQAEQEKQRTERAVTGTSLTDIPLPTTHPKVTVSKGIGATIFETSGNKFVGVILCIIAVVQIIVVTTVFSKQGGVAFPMPIFLVADTVMFAGGAFILCSRYTVTISSGKITLCFGVAGKGYRKEIARLAPVTVTLEPRGSSQNNRPMDSIVVRNADGAEFHFGPFLDDSRKQFLAGHLARLLSPKTTGTPSNPFE